MHVAVSWDISTSGDHWNQINDRMREVLKPFSWARPLSTFYVVCVSGETDRQTLQNGLQSVAKSVSETVHFVVSPLMSAGRYDGYLPSDMWPKINERTS